MTTEHQNFFGKNPTLGHTEILGTSNVGKTVLLMTKAFAAQQFGTPESFPANRKLKKLTTVFSIKTGQVKSVYGQWGDLITG